MNDEQNKEHKVLITGTGRAGTTFLVALLTELGLDTGFKCGEWQTHINDVPAFAGLEYNITGSHYILKNPEFSTQIKNIYNRCNIDHIYIPIRDLKSASESRIYYGSGRGGLWDTKNPGDQESILAYQLGYLFESLILLDIPFTALNFYQMIQDAQYTYNKLNFLVKHISFDHFKDIFENVSYIFAQHSRNNKNE